jgi:hypothetical protein
LPLKPYEKIQPQKAAIWPEEKLLSLTDQVRQRPSSWCGKDTEIRWKIKIDYSTAWVFHPAME